MLSSDEIENKLNDENYIFDLDDIVDFINKIKQLEKKNEEMLNLIYQIRDNQYEPEKIEKILIEFFDKRFKEET